MRSILVSLLVLTFAFAVFAEWEEYDLAPGAIPQINQPTDEQWDLQIAWEDMETQSGDNGMLGITFDGTNVWVTGRGTGPNMVYIFDPATGVMTNSFESGSTTSWGCRDLCFDGTYVYSGWESGVQCWDLQFNFVTMLPFPAGQQFPRAIAYDPVSDHFYCGNFGSTCYEFDRNGNTIRSWAPAPLSAVYGMAWDDDPLSGGPWLWVHDQTTPSSGCNIHQLDPTTLTYTGVQQTVNVPPSASDMAGGLDYHGGVDPLYTSMLVFNQGTPDAGAAFEMYPAGPPPDYDWTVELTATGTTTIPPGGGDLDYNIEITSNETGTTSGSVWTSVTLPAGGVVDLIGPINVTMTAGQVIDRDKVFTCPARAPAGAYTYNAGVGIPGAIIWDEDNIPFTKTGDGVGGGNWYSSGEPLPGEIIVEPEVPMDYAMMSAYPNPFNPQTFISFTLPNSGNAKMVVYDISGRQVATLFDNYVPAGQHDAFFNASQLSSGVYFVNLTAQNVNLTEKVMLVK